MNLRIISMVVIVLKTINRCNSACVYCFADKSGKLKKVEIPFIELLFDRIKQYLVAESLETVEIQWHGGEPLLLGKEFYKKVVVKQFEIFANENNRIIHSFQSNLILLTKEYLQVLMQLNLKNFGTSIDPEPLIRLLKSKNNLKNYMQLFQKGLRLLEENRVGYGINYVVTQKSFKESFAIFYYLTNIGLSGTVSVNPVLIKDKSLEYLGISSEEFARFIQNTFPLWWKRQKTFSSMEPYRSLYDAGRQVNKGITPNENFPEIPVIIDSDGNFYHHRKNRPIGNIQEHTLNQMVEQVKSINNHLINTHRLSRKCDECELWPYCYCNTLMDAFSQNEDFADERWCRARKNFMNDYLLQFLKMNNEAA